MSDSDRREHIHNFDRETKIDCERWKDFVILSSTYRYHKIRYTLRENLDDRSNSMVESDQSDASC
jgi:hypothetical protein